MADVVRGVRPPFDPHEVVRDFAALAREYRVTQIVGDRYSAEWVVSAFRGADLAYKVSDKSKSDIYLEALPLFTRAQISIPDHAPLLRELRLLERATHRGGRDSVDHPRSGSDDYANALCGCAVFARKPQYDLCPPWMGLDDEKPREDDPKVVEARRARLVQLLLDGQPLPF